MRSENTSKRRAPSGWSRAGEKVEMNQIGESAKTEMWDRKLCLFLSMNPEEKMLWGGWAGGAGKAEAARRYHAC